MPSLMKCAVIEARMRGRLRELYLEGLFFHRIFLVLLSNLLDSRRPAS
jgi:hypothetical protein